MVAQLDGVRLPFPESHGGRERKSASSGSALEGGLPTKLVERFYPPGLTCLYHEQQYEAEGKWVYEQHPFWCTGYTFWELHNEAPDLFLHLSRSDLVIFKGDLNHRKVRGVLVCSLEIWIDHLAVDIRLCCATIHRVRYCCRTNGFCSRRAKSLQSAYY